MHKVVVSRGLAPVQALPYAETPVELDALTVARVEAPPASVQQVLLDTFTEAVVVVHDGKIAAEWYAEPALATTQLPLHSITKSFIGCLAGLAIEEGLLDPERLAVDYVPDLSHGGYRTATVRDLLDMRTGGDYVETHGVADSELSEMGQIVGWEQVTKPGLQPSLRAMAAHIERPAEHLGQFSYRSLDTEVLAWVIEAALAAPLLDVLSTALLAPLGLEYDAAMLVDPVGCPAASGGLEMTARDLARFGLMLLNGGSVGDLQVLPPLFLKDTRNGSEDSVAAFQARVGERLGPAAPYSTQGLYRNQFWVPQRGRQRILGLGVYGQALVIDGMNQVVAVKLSRWPTAQSPTLFTDGLSALSAIAESLGGEPYDDPQLFR